MTRKDGPIGDDELDGLFGHLAGSPLALAVSGGADSMALMHLIARWARREDVKAKWAAQWQRLRTHLALLEASCAEREWRGLRSPSWLSETGDWDDLDGRGGPSPVVVLTVDHGLRPESAGEAAFVAEEARRLGLPCEILHWNGSKPTTGIQEAARNARRELMFDCLRAESGRLAELTRGRKAEGAWERGLVLAHHEEDQAETLLMRLARGSGLDGLTGMRVRMRAVRGARPERPTSFSVSVSRPLLREPKQRLVDTLRAGGHTWVEDPSNGDERFERVRVRKALATLGEVGMTPKMIALSVRRLNNANEAIDCLLARARSLQASDACFTALMAEQSLRDPEFSSHYLATRTLRRLIRRYGGSAREPELAQVEALAAEIAAGPWGGAAFGGATLGGCKIEVVGEKQDRFRVFREGSGEGLPVVPLEGAREFEWDGGRFLVSVAGTFAAGASLAPLGMAGWASLKKAVPEMAGLGWPAAAAATLPAVVRDGAVVDVPCLHELLSQLLGDASPVLSAWRARQEISGAGVCARFTGVVDW